MKKIAIILSGIVMLTALSAQGKVIRVSEGQDLRSAMKKTSPADTLVVGAGEYNMVSTFTLSGDLVIMGAPGEKPVVHCTGFNVGTKASKLVLEGLHIVYDRKYLVYAADTTPVNIDLIAVRDCIVDQNQNGGSIVLNRSAMKENRIGKIEIDNCVVFNAIQGSHGVLNVTTESTVEIGSLTMTNSTFADFNRGAVIISKPMAEMKITVSNCTFYNLNHSDNSGGIFRVDKGKVDISVSKSIFNFGGESPKFIVVSGSGKATVTDSYRTTEQRRVIGELGLQPASGTAAQVFKAPGNDPTADGVSFQIIDPKLAGQKIGDPRWF